jgi:hypothetical protein
VLQLRQSGACSSQTQAPGKLEVRFFLVGTQGSRDIGVAASSIVPKFENRKGFRPRWLIADFEIGAKRCPTDSPSRRGVFFDGPVPFRTSGIEELIAPEWMVCWLSLRLVSRLTRERGLEPGG